MEMNFSIELFMYALDKNLDNEVFEMWKLQFPNMTKENFISFDEYKEKLLGKKHTEISYEDIEKEMNRIIKAYEGR
ncbi:hypothetical protein [Clostridium omnivorum]|nr:hypothetical protein [Clostridium sp. E14]